MFLRKIEPRSLPQDHMHIKKWGFYFHIVSEPICVARNQSHPQTFVSEYGKLLWLVIIKGWCSFFIFLWKRHPSLNHFKSACQRGRIFKSFRMRDASTCSHPVHFTRTNNLLNT